MRLQNARIERRILQLGSRSPGRPSTGAVGRLVGADGGDEDAARTDVKHVKLVVFARQCEVELVGQHFRETIAAIDRLVAKLEGHRALIDLQHFYTQAA